MSKQQQTSPIIITFLAEDFKGTLPKDIYCKDFFDAVQAVEKVLEFKSTHFVQIKKDFDRDGKFGFKRKGIIAWILKTQ